jgi:hypothetical protein
MDFVTDGIAIGGRTDAADYQRLRGNGITAVLNVAWDLDIVYPSRSVGASVFALEYQKVGLIDGPGNRPETLMAAVWMLGQLAERHDRILVHCHAGVSRSTTVTALHLATTNGESFRECLNRVRERHPVTNPHRELIQLAAQVESAFHRLRT